MSKVSQYPPGTFNWVDQTTDELDKAKAFYTKLFGWQAKDIPTDDGSYSVLRKDGQDVAAIALPPPILDGTAAMWNSYISVEDIDASASKAEALRGSILVEPTTIGTAGRLSIIADPEGAVFALWQAGDSRGSAVVNEPGTLAWNELYTRDIEQALDFYGELFGWRHKVHQLSEGKVYHMFSVENRDRAGIHELTPDMDQVSPRWEVYFAVADLEASYYKLTELGGKAAFSPGTVPTIGRFIRATDIGGAPLSLITVFHEPKPL